MVDVKELRKQIAECKDILHGRKNEEDGKIYSVLCGMELLLTPVSAEIEGGGSSWFFVCGECHGQIDSKDRVCRHCGSLVSWRD